MLLARLAALVAAAAISSPTAAQDVPEGPGHGAFTTRIGFYDKSDGGDGNPFFDESLTVIEPVLIFDYNVSDKTSLSGTLSYDYVSSASIDRLSMYPAQSGASGDNFIGGDLAMLYKYSPDMRLGGHLGVATEYDYTSLAFGTNIAWDRQDKDATVSFSLNGFLDSIDVIRWNGVEEGSDDRTSLAGTLKWYQVLSPKAHGEFGATVSRQSGFLETAFNAVIVEDGVTVPTFPFENGALGFEINEELPDTRLRTALFGKARRLMTDSTSIELGGRIYNDDWGITAFDIEPRIYQNLIKDKLDLRLRYRYYTQSAADDYIESLTTPLAIPKFRTQDSDLADFDSNTLGAKLLWYLGSSNSLDFGVDYVLRSDGLDHVFASFGWRHVF